MLERVWGYIDGLSDQETNLEIPDWQKNEVRERLADYKKNPSSAHNWEDVMDEVDRELE
ncbi:addiction module protein [Chryseobacterium sp. MP_3.2]|uniref:addiction module protein n=1 Tax=Chryseobacterium sp. MP_3.2 TaxID=3071712 RepID=UPI003FA351A9